VAALSVLLARNFHATDVGKPARARVHPTGHALSGAADAEGQDERRVLRVADQGRDLLRFREHDHPLIPPEKGEDAGRQVPGGTGFGVTQAYVIAGVVVDVEAPRAGSAQTLVDGGGM